MQDDPHWRDLILFYEYFHGDNGAGIGASHQTGWTALVAGLIALFGTISAEKLKQEGAAAIARQPAAPKGAQCRADSRRLDTNNFSQ